MVNSKVNNFLIPNVTKVTTNKNSDSVQKTNSHPSDQSFEFKNLLDERIGSSENVTISGHALKRLSERNLNLDKDELRKIETAIDRLKLKGGQDSLVITHRAAYIVDVDNRVVVTAVDKENLSENVFTKIDSTILMN